MAELVPVDVALHQHGHAITESGLEIGVRVDIELDDRGAGLQRERRERRAHVVAQVTVRAGEQRQPTNIHYSPGFSVV